MKDELKKEKARRLTDDDVQNRVNFLVTKKAKLGQKNRYYYYLHDYKTVATSKEDHLEIDLPDSMVKFLLESLAIVPRKWLISSLKNVNEPIKYQGWRTLAIGVLNDEKESLGGQADLFRQIYVSAKFADKNLTANAKQDIARQMATSVAMLDGEYNVIQNKQAEKPVKPIKSKNVQKIETPEILPEDPKEVQTVKKVLARRAKNQEKSSKYYKENAEKMREQNKKNYEKNKTSIAKSFGRESSHPTEKMFILPVLG